MCRLRLRDDHGETKKKREDSLGVMWAVKCGGTVRKLACGEKSSGDVASSTFSDSQLTCAPPLNLVANPAPRTVYEELRAELVYKWSISTVAAHWPVQLL